MIKFSHKKNGVAVYQDSRYVGYINYSKLYGYLITYVDETILEIDEQKEILDKMIEMQTEDIIEK